jgi:dolichyl-phosphate beta-glucosyltransferase
MDFFIITDFFAILFIIFSALLLVYAIMCTVFNDETIYDMEYLPTTDPRKLTYYLQPEPPEGPTLFPSVFDDPEVYVSFVIPAYNEEKRLPPMLNATIEYLKARRQRDPTFTYEIVIVNDGSRDKTSEVALSYAAANPEIRLLVQPYNMGKGAAIQTGCLHARGTMMLMVDADGATTISEFESLENRLKTLMERNGLAIVVGSRAQIGADNKAKRDIIRYLLGKAFHVLVYLAGVRGIKDTQCGFKLFSRGAAAWLFPNQHSRRWAFDSELLMIGRTREMQIAEEPIEWNEIEGSKMTFRGMVKMATDILCIAIFHRIGIWTIRDKSDRKTFADD